MSSEKEFPDVELAINNNLKLWKDLDEANYYLNRLQRVIRHCSARAVATENQYALIDDLARQVTFYRNHARKVETKLKEAEARARVAESAVRLYRYTRVERFVLLGVRLIFITSLMLRICC